MCNPKFRKESYKKRFFRSNNPLLRDASTVINQLYGTNEEKLGQLEMLVKTETFQKRFPGLIGKDVAAIVRLELSKF